MQNSIVIIFYASLKLYYFCLKKAKNIYCNSHSYILWTYVVKNNLSEEYSKNIKLHLEEGWYSLEQYITSKPMYCSREYQPSSRLIQQYEKSTPNIKLHHVK